LNNFFPLEKLSKKYIDTIWPKKLIYLRCELDVRYWEQIIEPLGMCGFPSLVAFFVARAISRLNHRSKEKKKGGILLWQKAQ
jgi:hypothetical protein